MLDSIGYCDGKWIPVAELGWSIHDLGPMYGAIAVERLRTLGGRLHAAELYYRRFVHTTNELRCNPLLDFDQWLAVVEGLIERNSDLLASQGDMSLVVLASPGLRTAQGKPTLMAYLEPLPHNLLAERYTAGVPLVVGRYRNIPPACWPTSLKVRSRLHYYLADLEASATEANAIALLLDTGDVVTDTSIACPIFNLQGHWVSPRSEAILPSVTMQFFETLLREEFGLTRRTITAAELPMVEEIMLLGTTGQLHAVRSIDFASLGQGKKSLPGVHGAGYQRCLVQCIKALGFDFVAAASLQK